MTVISRINTRSPSAGTRPNGASNGFSLSAGATARPSSASAAAAASPVSLSGLLALQERETGAERDRAARRHGTALLLELSKLQRALLGSSVEQSEAVAHLAELSSRGHDASDPALASIIRAVSLRARIEVARREARNSNEFADAPRV